MAEFVQKKLEDMIPEMEELERTGLLSKDQVAELIRTRRDWLYKLASRHPSKTDFISFIKYEADLLYLIKLKRDVLRMYEKVNEIDKAIISRQIKLLCFMTRKWWNDINLWQIRIDFAKSVGNQHEVRRAYSEWSKKHSYRLHVWVDWAQYELSVRRDFRKAREILVSKAALNYSDKRILRRELFKFELLQAEFTFKKHYGHDPDGEGKGFKNILDIEKKVFSCAAAKIVYKHALNESPTVSTALELYQSACRFPFAKYLKEEIYQDMLERFPSTPEIALLKASKAAVEQTLKQEDENQLEEKLSKKKKKKQQKNKESPEEEDVEFLKPYKLYVANLKTKHSKKATLMFKECFDMVNHYLQSLMSAIESVAEDSLESFVSLLLDEIISLLWHCWHYRRVPGLLVQTYSKICSTYWKILTPIQFITWGLLLECGDVTAKVDVSSTQALEKGLETHPDVPIISIQYLRHTCRESSGDNVAIINAYKKIKRILQKAPIEWQRLALQNTLSELTSGSEKEDFLKSHCTPSTDIRMASSARVALFWFAFEERGIEGAREAFKQSLPSDELHPAMVSLELAAAGLPETTDKKQAAKFDFDLDFDGDDDSSDDSDHEENEEQDEASQVMPGNETIDANTMNESVEEGETTAPKPDIERIRTVFEADLQYKRGRHHDFWLCYCLFEEKYGKAIKYSRVIRDARNRMDAWSIVAFKEIMMDIRDSRYINDDTEESSPDASTKINVPKTPLLFNYLHKYALKSITRNMSNQRTSLFEQISKTVHSISSPVEPNKDLVVTWYDVLCLLLGNRVKPRFDSKEAISIKHKKDEFHIHENLGFKSKKKALALSTKLFVAPEEELEMPATIARLECNSVNTKDTLEAILAKSDVLKPEFAKKDQLEPELSKKEAQKLAKEKRSKTLGKGWDYMEAPEITPELKNDLELLQMRNILNPKQKYKTTTMKVLPKYFQVGTIVDDPRYFYSSRLTKKERKQTIAEQIISDQEVVSYQKRKYAELVARKEGNRRFNKKRKINAGDYITLKK